MEEQRKKIRPEGVNRMPELEESIIKAGPYGTNETLEMLGESGCQIKAKVEVEMTTMAYMTREHRSHHWD